MEDELDIDDPAKSSEPLAPLPPSPANPLSDEDAAYEAHARYEETWDLAHLDDAIALYQRASDAAPEPDADLLGWLGYCLTVRYLALGQLDDLERGIAAAQHALKLTSDEHIDQPLRLHNLAWPLRIRYERLGELNDLDNAMTMQQHSVELTPADHPGLSARLGNLGSLYYLRYKRFGALDDLEHSIANQQRAVDLVPDGHPSSPIRLNNLGMSLRCRFERLGEPDDLERAIIVQRRAVELGPEGHPDMPAWLDNLGSLHHLRYERFGDFEDLERAIEGQRRAVGLTPDGHPNKPTRLHNLGLSLQAYFRRERSPDTFNAALSCFMTATESQVMDPPAERLKTAKRAARFLNKYSEFSTRETVIDAHTRILNVLPEIVWLGHDLQRRLEESKHLGELVNAAVCAAVEACALEKAVEWLDAGRGLLWAQALSLRSPVDDLECVHPGLARPLRRVLAQLQDTVHASSRREAATVVDRNVLPVSSTVTTEGDRHRGLAIEYGKLISEVRSQPGFESFMRPKKFSAMAPSSVALSEPVVFLNVDQAHCDALILKRNGSLVPVALPELSLAKAETLRSRWQTYLHEQKVRERSMFSSQWGPFKLSDALKVLGLIWKWIVHPVMEALSLNKINTSCEPLPHITWCPTGPLTQLPLHAAGIYNEACGPRLCDFAVSSYTTSLTALTRCVDAHTKQSTVTSVLVVTQPATPGFSPLPGTTIEGERLKGVFAGTENALSVLEGERATTGLIKQVLANYPWLHLACHGSQNVEDPLQSAFALHDGPLSLVDLMNTTLDHAELAFLSACQTAVGDEKIPEESMHLAAGMLAVGYKGVIATMWSIRDDDAPLVVEAYYKKLLELRASGILGKGETGAAYALHEATKRLRDYVGVENVVRWAPFVHFGI